MELTPFRRSHILPPSEMKSLYGSITRSAVNCLSYVTFAIVYLQRSYASGILCLSVARALSLNGLVHERRDRLACLDDIRRQHPPGFRAEVARIMRGPRGNQKSLPCAQYNGGTSLYPHLDLACNDIADLFSRMNVPSRLDSRRNQRLHLNHLATWNRQRRALDLAPGKLARQVVPCPLIGPSKCGDHVGDHAGQRYCNQH